MDLAVAAILFDLDGTIYLGEEAIPGAVAAIQALRGAGIRTLFVSNKPLEPRTAYAAKLSRLGIPTPADDVITSGYVLGYHLARYQAHLRLYVIGEPFLIAELRGHGLHVVAEFDAQDEKHVIDPQGVDAVVVAFDRTLDNRKINTAYQALINGAHFYATNADKSCPLPGGSIPDAGATIAALEHISGRKLELLAGKPSPLIVEVALQKLGLLPERVLMVGDRLETDILMGQNAGMRTAAVLTGASTRDDIAQLASPPDLVLESVADLAAALSVPRY